MEQTEKVYLYGASGHAKVVLDIVRSANMVVPCLIDDNPEVEDLSFCRGPFSYYRNRGGLFNKA